MASTAVSKAVQMDVTKGILTDFLTVVQRVDSMALATVAS